MSDTWTVEEEDGTASSLHAGSAALLEPAARPSAGAAATRTRPLRRRVRVLRAAGPAVVLGSAEPASHVDASAAAGRGVEVARRRSGGAAVLVGPGEVLWVDVAIPRGDPLWDDDVGRAAWWLGELWAGALTAAGVDGATVWRGPFRPHPWSDRVCFAGVGAGEVVLGRAGGAAGAGGAGPPGPKVVGVSQRRTRAGALFQCAALLRWAPADLLAVLDLDADRRRRGATELAGVAAAVGAGLAPALLRAVLCRFPTAGQTITGARVP